MFKVLITGGTGLIGARLSFLLQSQGYSVSHLSRKPNKNATFPAFRWDLDAGYLDPAALDEVQAIIHLAGEGIADKRWTAERRQQILDSRTKSSALLAKALAEHKDRHRVRTVVCASAIGFYGDTGSHAVDETAPAGTDFMAEVCRHWEQSSQQIRDLSIRCPLVRIGIVLSTKGGALAKMLPSYKLRIGTYFGNGAQFYAWIHIDDACRALQFCLENPNLQAIYNATAPAPVSNYDLAQSIAQAMQKKCLLLPVPRFALRLALGEMSSVVTTSTRALPTALLAEGFPFQHPDLVPAIRQLLEEKL